MSVSAHSSCCGRVLGNAWSYHVSADVWSPLGNVFVSNIPFTHPGGLTFVRRGLQLLLRVILLNLLFSFLEENTQSTARMCNRDNHSKIPSTVLFARMDKNGWVLCEIADWLIIHDPSRLFTQWETNTGSFVLFWVLLANLFDLAVCK